MRIAHLVIGGDVAGGQLVALQLGRAAQAANHVVSFVSPSDGEFVDLVRAEGFEADIVPISGALGLRSAIRLIRLFRRERITLVHTHGHFAVNTVGRVAARLAGAQVLSHMHIENAFRSGRGRRAQIAVDNASARLCYAIVAVSDATTRRLLTQGYPRDRLVTVRNGIDPTPAPEAVRLAEGPTILEVARLAEIKGQRTLIEALTQLEATAVFVGRDLEHGGDFEAELKELARRLGVADRTVFAGYRTDVAGLLAGCDIVCLPSAAEGLPLVLLEAMSQGRPVVATAVGGTPELVSDGETGYLVPPGDAVKLAEALRRLLADDDLARSMGEAARRRVTEQFSAAASAERILRLYDTAP